MGAFSADTMKPTYWMGDSEVIPTMKKPIKKNKFARTPLVTHRPDGRITGNVKRIKQSQVYTREYGQHVFREWRKVAEAKAGRPITANHDFSDSDSDESLTAEEYNSITYDNTVFEEWKFAGFGELCADLNMPIDKLLVECD